MKQSTKAWPGCGTRSGGRVRFAAAIRAYKMRGMSLVAIVDALQNAKKVAMDVDVVGSMSRVGT